MRIALCQILSSPDSEANLKLIADGIRRAAEAKADLAIFPEASMASFEARLGPLAEPLDGPWAGKVRRLADRAGIAVVAGMFTPTKDGRVTNTLLVTGRGLDTRYDKIHLYDAFGFSESNTVAAGTEPLVIELDGIKVGVTTCYDIRFPGLYQALADRDASVIVTSASWGAGEGKREQWELLVRARALDSTSWLVACGQADPRSIGREPTGRAPTGIGYSMVATPTGGVHAQLAEAPDVLVVDVDTSTVARARQTLPVLVNRRF